MNDQDEIRQFTDNIFNKGVAGCTSKYMNYKQYEYVNKTVSSEMFYSLMAILHEKLPCATNFFRLKKNFRDMRQTDKASSPVRTIASPKMIRGLSITKALKKDASGVSSHGGSPKRISSPDIRIKNLRQSDLSRR